MLYPTSVRYNRRKAQVLEVFASRGALRPIHLAVEARIYPFRRVYTYLLRLHRWGYLLRDTDYKGRIVYRLSSRGAWWLLRLKQDAAFRRRVLKDKES